MRCGRGPGPDRAWPRGALNFPRSFFTEKAFPENESVWTTAIGTGAEGAVGNTLVYERRLGARNQFEASVPLNFQQGEGGPGLGGIGGTRRSGGRARV